MSDIAERAATAVEAATGVAEVIDTALPVVSEPQPLDELSDMWRVARRIADTEFVPKALRNRPEAVMAAIIAGRELGLPPMMSLQNIAVIEGKPTLSAQAMRAIVIARGHLIERVESDDEHCVMRGQRSDTGQELTVTWTMADVAKGGIDKGREGVKTNWRMYPAQMLTARATSELCRLLFADLLGGLSYAGDGGELS